MAHPQEEATKGTEGPPPPFESVAVCVDYSPATDDAIALGRALAGNGRRLTLLHATEMTPGRTWVRMMLAMPDVEWEPLGEEFLDRLAKQHPDSEAVLLKGHPSVAIEEWVAEAEPDVVVCGAHHTGLERAALGSVSSHLLSHVRRPVAIARSGARGAGALGHVAACVDADEHAPEVLAAAYRIAAPHDAALSALHVVDDPGFFRRFGRAPDRAKLMGIWEEKLTEIVAPIPSEPVLLEGHPAGPVASAWAQGAKVDLLVVAARGEVANRYFLGGFASHLAHSAACSVLVTR
jgi:nucleotide-binding universal stress UspA family protein